MQEHALVGAPPIRRVRGAIYLCYAGEALAFSAVMARIPHIQRSHGLSDQAINVLVALVPVLAVAGGLFAARLNGRAGSGLVLRCAQPVFFAAVVLLGAVPGTGALVASVALYGVAMGVVEAAMNAQAVAIERHAGRSLVNGFFAVWSGASIAGSLWISFANGAGLSLPVGFAVPAAIGLLIAVATVRLPLRKDAERSIAQAAEQRAARRLLEAGERGGVPAVGVPWRPLLVLGAALACAYVAEGAISGFAVKYVRDELGGADTVAPLAITAFAAATVTGRAVADLVVRRRGPAWLIRGGALLAAVGLAAAVLAPAPWVAIAGFAGAGLGLCSVAPGAYAAAARHDPIGQGVAVARVGVFNYLGAVAGTGLVAVLAPVSGYWACYLVAAVLVLVIIPLAGRFAPRPS
ncbi:MFS transporter [Actinomadura sp. NBRC 104425]|uniref:MFS transporter n=1 Tax=Actinomadura sp. NBRC 104425 TaxID=3032204 RepID=UPI0025555405|nr:MFS transporter [Actinomadura sp. NBRC 104425]